MTKANNVRTKPTARTACMYVHITVYNCITHYSMANVLTIYKTLLTIPCFLSSNIYWPDVVYWWDQVKGALKAINCTGTDSLIHNQNYYYYYYTHLMASFPGQSG